MSGCGRDGGPRGLWKACEAPFISNQTATTRWKAWYRHPISSAVVGEVFPNVNRVPINIINVNVNSAPK